MKTAGHNDLFIPARHTVIAIDPVQRSQNMPCVRRQLVSLLSSLTEGPPSNQIEGQVNAVCGQQVFGGPGLISDKKDKCEHTNRLIRF